MSDSYHDLLADAGNLSESEVIAECRRYLKADALGSPTAFVQDCVDQYAERDSLAPGQWSGLRRCIAYQWKKNEE